METAKQAVNIAPASDPPKVDFATDLFNMLSMDDQTANTSEATPADDNSWAGFQCMYLSSIYMIIVAHFFYAC